MKKILILLLCSAFMLSAQSLFGVRYPGGLGSTKTGFASRMGGAGIGVNNGYLLMAHNPGNLGNINQSVYTLKFTLDYTRLYEGDEHSDFVSMVPDLVGFAFPLGNIGTFGLTFSKERGNKYAYKSADGVIATNSLTGETLTGWTGFYRKSGTTAWEVAWGHKAWKFFRPGISYRRYYFSIEDNRVVKVDNFGGTGDSTDVKQSGNAIRGGFSGSIGKFTYGLSANYNFMSDARYKRMIQGIDSLSSGYHSSLTHVNAKLDTTYDLQLPPSGGIGLSYKINEKMFVAADFSMELWEDAYTNGPTSLFFEKYQNTKTTSLGFEFIPAPQLLAPRYWEKILYSGGIRFGSLPIEGDIEFAANIGFGLPIGRAGLLDLAFEGGTRRSDSPELENNHENFFKFSITTSGGKKWKKKSNQVY